MGDPFSREARWSDSPEEASGNDLPWEVLRSDPAIRHRVWTRRRDRGIDLCNQLRPVPAAETLWDCVLEGGGNAEDDSVARFWFACASHDAGDVEEALSVLRPALHWSRLEASPETAARVWTRYALALIERPVPLAKIVEHLEKTEAVCQSRDSALGQSRLQLLSGRLLVARGLYSEAFPHLENALETSQSDPVAFSQTSHWRWLTHASIRAREWERARSYLERWRDSFQAPDLQGEISIRVAESELHLAQGRVAEARREACSALDCCNSHRDNRYRVAACCAFLSAVAASGELANSRHRLREVLRWRRRSLGELRYEVRRVHLKHVVSRDLQRSRVAMSRLTSSDELPARSGRAWRVALREARMLDNRLETTHRTAEIARWVADSSAGRPLMALEHRQD
jgi:tetratricopeptide (TPR) repeat protein